MEVGSSVAASVKPSGLFLAQVLLSGGVNADDVAVGDKQRNHDLEASGAIHRHAVGILGILLEGGAQLHEVGVAPP